MTCRPALLPSLLILLAAAPAGAATRYVAQTARGTGTGADSSNAQSIANFNSLAVAGDVALLLGNFTTIPNPTNSGTLAAPIVYRSRSGNRNDVCFTGSFAITGSRADSNVVWRDITIRGGVQLGGSTQTARWQMQNVRVIDGGLAMYFARDCRLDNVNVTQTQPASGLFAFAPYNPSDSTTACRRDTLRSSSLALLAADGTGNTAINIFSGYDNFYEAVRCSVVTTTNAGTALRFARVNRTNRGVMKDCYFYGVNNQSGGGSDEPMTFSFKDGVKIFKMVRDTIIIRGNANGAAPWILFAQNETDGNPALLGEEIGGNSFRSCYFRNETDATWPVSWIYQGFDGDSVVGNTFIGKTSSISSYYNRGDPVMATNTIVDHNLFVTFSHAPAFQMLNGTANQGVIFTNNIFYSPNLTDADTTGSRAVDYGRASDWVSSSVGPIGNNYNVVWTPRVTTRRGVKWSGGMSAMGLNPWLSARNPAVLDASSSLRPMLFVDSTLANFDPHPLSGSGALTGPDGYVGPFGLGGSLDVTPPGAITDLKASGATQTSMNLDWTAPGNDGYTGTATAYDVRWSTAPIDAIAFATATSVSNPPVPAPAGTAQGMVVSGLPSGLVCYFAIKARDAAGNWSLLSNVPAAQTLVADTTPPAAVQDLRTNP